MAGRRVLEAKTSSDGGLEERIKRQILALRRRQIILEGQLMSAKEAELTDAATGIGYSTDGQSLARLEVVVGAGDNIRLDAYPSMAFSILGTDMAYVQARIVPAPGGTQRTRRQRLPTPQWHETLHFDALPSLSASVYIEVKHAMRFSPDVVLGHIVLPFEELLAQHPVDKTFALSETSRLRLQATLTYSSARVVHEELTEVRQDMAALTTKLAAIQAMPPRRPPSVVQAYISAAYRPAPTYWLTPPRAADESSRKRTQDDAPPADDAPPSKKRKTALVSDAYTWCTDRLGPAPATTLYSQLTSRVKAFFRLK
ncbi:hypothetical protein SDRG_14992 [Saprolegnia diclina VS20]|uniref:C2 domain-containing protein n=1 Tax=Saprolegnia diclina (strain VS20) TaxID=1156394 RepID=T0Q1D8_SAPDV|nr:hypothetical protein SDRG_14992 [Saprolegnia diclina VS20]EQC27190.1 hypothetical protein SDRG_14992 [Saprolegnia diclina VS20]|eukprot:XP_008619377.1 hypothetical protein SDRG_14992 [Saprolegnia diclina VS20]